MDPGISRKDKMGHRLADVFFKNVWLKILSLAIGFLIWMLVSNANNPIRTQLFTNVPITIVNRDSVTDIGKVVEPEGSGTVTLRVTARRSILEQLSRNGSDFYVEADMENLNDMDAVPLSVTCSNSAVTWDEIQVSPSSLKVTLEDKVEQIYVCSVSTEGVPASGLQVGTTALNVGKNIVIAGPRSLMKIINQVVAPINVGGLDEDTTLTSILNVYDKNGDEFTDAQLSSLEFKDESGNVIIDHTVEVEVDFWKIKTDVPIRVQTKGSTAWGYRVSAIRTIPETISVAGTEEALANLGNEFLVEDKVDITAASTNVTTEIDLTGTLSNMPGIKLITDTDPNVQVEVLIEQDGNVTLQIPLAVVTLKNRPEGMSLVFTPADILSVSVRAVDADAPGLKDTDLSLSVDLAQCEEAGNYELPLQVDLPEGYELTAPVTIKVNSSPQETTASTEGE